MARKQKDYLAGLLADDEPDTTAATAPVPEYKGVLDEVAQHNARQDRLRTEREAAEAQRRERRGATTLLGRESALARVASGEVRQVTQLLLDPARVRVWPGNARSYAHLSEESCRELIDSIIAENGQKVPVVVRRVEGDAEHDYEVIAGTRRHWSINWLRVHNYPDMQLLAQVQQLDDEAAFRLADLENRARADVSDLERARNYAAALAEHYDNHQTRMAERLRVSKGWLSRMLKVAAIPDAVVNAFASPAEVQMTPAYPLAQALAEPGREGPILREAARIVEEQADLRQGGHPPLPASAIFARLMAAGRDRREKGAPLVLDGAHGRPAVSVQGSNRQGVTLRLHSGHGLSERDLLERVRAALKELADTGRGLQR